MIEVKIGDTIGYVYYRHDKKKYELIEGKITDFFDTNEGKIAKAENFYRVPIKDIEENTEWIFNHSGIVLQNAPFIMNEEIRKRAIQMIEEANTDWIKTSDNHVGVVRCKDCSYWMEDERSYDGCLCWAIDKYTTPDFYCKAGVKRESKRG